MTKTAFKKEEDSFLQEIGFKRKEKTSKMHAAFGA
jgi:hemerythrin